MAIEEEKSYPRGGVTSLKKRKRVEDSGEGAPTTKEFPSKKKKASRGDDLFGKAVANTVRGPESKKKKKAGTKKNTSREDASEDPKEISRVGDLFYGSLSVGMKVLGVVYSVEQYQVKISLPGFLVASLPITKISKIYNDLLVKIAESGGTSKVNVPHLEDMLPEGTILPLTISSINKSEEGKYRVKVSAEPELNVPSLHHISIGTRLSGIISSIQDHGYTLDIGLKGVRAFLPSSKKQKSYSVGEILTVNLSGKDEVANTASLSLKRKSLAETPTSIHSLLPGMRLKVAFKKKVIGGITVSFGDLEGVIPFPHYDVEEEFEENQEFEATVLYIAPIVNVVYLTSKLGTVPPGPIKPGELLEDLTVTSVSPRGIYLKKIVQKLTCLVFISPFEAMNGLANFNKLKEAFPLRSKVKAVRLIQVDAITSVFIGSLKKDMIDIGLVSVKSLNIGDHVTAKIKSYTDKGVHVSMGRIQGFIRRFQLTNIPLNNPEVKHPVGSKLKCRVLTLPGTDKKKKGITLTSKPMLVKSERPVIDSYDSKFINVDTLGVVVQANNKGILLELFGGVQGWVSKKEISTDPVEYPEKMFHVGQVIKCRVKKVMEEHKSMLLTLILSQEKPSSKTSNEKPKGAKKPKCKLSPGSKHACKVTQVDSNGLSVEFQNDDETEKGFIPTHHLTDNLFLADSLRSSYAVGDAIPEALFFSKDALPIFSLKKSLLTYEPVKSFQDLHIGITLPAVVKKIGKVGPSVTFLATKSSFRTETILLRNLTDFYVKDIRDLISLGSSIFVKIIGKKDQDYSLTLSSNLSNVNTEVSLVKNLIEELKLIRGASKGSLGNYEEGMVLSGKLIEKTNFGVFVSLEKGLRGVITNTNLDSDMEIEPDSLIPVVVLCVDYENEIIELTNRVDIVSNITLKKDRPLKEGFHVQAKPIWSRDDYHYILMIIESPFQYKGHLLKVASRKNLNDWKGKFDGISFDKEYRVLIKDRFECIGVMENFKVEKPPKDNPPKRKASDKAAINEKALKKIKIPESKVVETPAEVEESCGTSMDMEDEDFNPWGEGPLLERVNEEDGSEEKGKKKKTHLSKGEAKALSKLEKEEIQRAEELVIKGEEPEPESKEDYEKLLISNPDSSLHWIQYIAFHADKGELVEARSVIKKALEKINFREEEERLNVYIAWFNLENSVGSEDEVESLFKEILRYNNEYKVYSRVSLIYSQTDKLSKAEEMLKMMARKFSKELDVWAKLGRYHFEKSKNLKEARFTLQRALQNLEKKQHVEITIKFAQMEFKFGEIERGKTIFETIVSNYPKRTDIWNVYADTLVKANELQAARDLFERMITLNLQPKKMKAIFKKYIDFETSNGDDFKVDRIKKKALEYVESKVGSLDTE